MTKYGLAAMVLLVNTAIITQPVMAEGDAKRQEMIKIYQFGLSKADDKNWALLLANTAERLGLDGHSAAHYLSYLAHNNRDMSALLSLRDDFVRSDNQAALFKLDQHLEALLCGDLVNSSDNGRDDSRDNSGVSGSEAGSSNDSGLNSERMLNLPELSRAACAPQFDQARRQYVQTQLSGHRDTQLTKEQWRKFAWLNRPAYFALRDDLFKPSSVDESPVEKNVVDLAQAPLSVRLDYAMATRNHEQLKNILTSKDSKQLSRQQKIYLYAELGYFSTARALARAELATELTPADHDSLLSTLAWLEYRQTPHLVGLDLSYNSGLSRDSVGIFYHAPLGEQRVLFELDHERFDLSKNHSRQDWLLALKGRKDDLSYALSLHGDTDKEDARLGQSLTFGYQHSSSVSFSAGAENNAPILYNQRWRLAGMQDHLYVGASFKLYSDWRLSTRIDQFDYQSRQQALSLDFYQLDASLEHKLANTRDSWVYLNTTWQSDIDTLPATAITPGLDADYQLAQSNLDPYRRVAIGVRKAQAITPELALIGPFNWHVDASLGYLTEAKELGFAIASSARWRLTDNQIIELSLEHQAQAREGGETNALSLTYYLDLDGL